MTRTKITILCIGLFGGGVFLGSRGAHIEQVALAQAVTLPAPQFHVLRYAPRWQIGGRNSGEIELHGQGHKHTLTNLNADQFGVLVDLLRNEAGVFWDGKVLGITEPNRVRTGTYPQDAHAQDGTLPRP